jgi:predicted transcriptional regulator
MPEADNRKILQVRVPSNLANQVAALARAHNKSTSQLLREAVEEYVAGADIDQLQEELRDRFEIERRRLLETQQPAFRPTETPPG